MIKTSLAITVLLLLTAAAAIAQFNDVASGDFGDGPTWGQTEPWAPPVGTYTMDDNFTIQVNETADDYFPTGATVNLNSGTLQIRRAVGTGSPYPEVILNGTLNLNGGTIDAADNAYQRLRGTLNVNSNTTIRATQPAGSSLGLFIGDDGAATTIKGSGNLIFTGNADAGSPRLWLDTADPWSGSLSVQGGTLVIQGTRTTIGNAEIYTNATMLGYSRHLAGRLSGKGTYKADDGVAFAVTSAGTVAPGIGAGDVGTLNIGNLKFAATARPTLTFSAGSVFEVDVTSATTADLLTTSSNYPSGGSGDHSVNFVIASGAKLKPVLYTPTANTNIDVTIIRVGTNAGATITGTFDTFDQSSVPDGWQNLATDLRNSNRELHFTAEFTLRSRGTLLMLK